MMLSSKSAPVDDPCQTWRGHGRTYPARRARPMGESVRLNNNDALSRGDAIVFPVPDWDEDWPSGTYVSGPGCFAYQLDGASLSMLIVFSVKITT